MSWIDLQLGTFFEIGKIAEFPVCIEIHFQVIDGKNILFYEACSRVVDYDMVTTWLKDNYKSKTRIWNAMNFHNALIV